MVSGLVVARALEANWGSATGLGMCSGGLCGGFWRRERSAVFRIRLLQIILSNPKKFKNIKNKKGLRVGSE